MLRRAVRIARIGAALLLQRTGLLLPRSALAVDAKRKGSLSVFGHYAPFSGSTLLKLRGLKRRVEIGAARMKPFREESPAALVRLAFHLSQARNGASPAAAAILASLACCGKGGNRLLARGNALSRLTKRDSGRGAQVQERARTGR